MRTFLVIVICAAAALAGSFALTGGDDSPSTSAASSGSSEEGLTAEEAARKAAYRDTYRAAKFTCGGFSRKALARGFNVPGGSTEPNDIGLTYSANFDSDARFSRARAAYNGCLTGMGK